MTTKLIDMNIGIQLTLLVDGKQKMVKWSAVCPSEAGTQPIEIIGRLCDFINSELEREFVLYDVKDEPVKVAKPKRIKAHRAVSQEEFNKRIKELQP